ncbi:hypothetical protein Tco_0664191 [Tanacetum coccineum]
MEGSSKYDDDESSYEQMRRCDILRGDKNFKAGDKVLIFNSRFKMHPGKLKSKWYDPCVVKTIHPYGTMEIIDKKGVSFKVNGHRLKKYHDGYNNEEEKEDLVKEISTNIGGESTNLEDLEVLES